MKPLYLVIEGVKSFIERQEIDFSLLTRDGIFGIFGDTGSGKSTVLDSIILSLYNRTQKSNDKAECVNFKCSHAYVDFTFKINYQGDDCVFEVVRDIQLKKDRSLGNTTSLLYQIVAEKKQALAEGITPVNNYIEKIIGLKFEDFCKCIALPQGEFDSFTNATRADRLDIISRLFNLEKYGAKLYSKINDRVAEITEELKIEEGKLALFVDVNEDGLKELNDGLKTSEDLAKTLTQKSEELAKNIRSLEVFENKQLELEDTTNKLNELLSIEEEINKDRVRVDVYPTLKELFSLIDEIEKSTANLKETEKEIQNVTVSLQELESEYNRNKEEDVFKDYTNIFNELSVRQNELNNLKSEAKDYKESNEKLVLLRTSLKEINAKISKAQDDKIKAENDVITDEEILKTIPDLGELLTAYKESETAFVLYKKALEEKRYLVEKKDVIFKHENSALKDAILDEINRLILLIENEISINENKSGFSNENFESAFKNLSDKAGAKDLAVSNKNNALINLEKLKGELTKLETEKSSIIEQGKILSEQISRLNEKFNSLTNGVELEEAITINSNKISDLKSKYEKLSESLEILSKKIAESSSRIEKLNERKILVQENLTEKSLKRDEILNTCDIIDKNNLKYYYISEADYLIKKKTIEDFDFNKKRLLSKKEELTALIKGETNLSNLKTMRVEFEELTDALRLKNEEVAVYKGKVNDYKSRLKQKAEIKNAIKLIEKRFNTAKTLATLTISRKFLEFVADEYLYDIAFKASSTLLKLSQGKYGLTYDKEFYVLDNYNAGEMRRVATLSGGETFLVSLSLAFSLSVEIYSKSNKPIEFFFLDEGFGTLDETLLEVVMDSLEKLKSPDFTIGLISHVKELKERIASKILVTGATEDSGSLVEIV